VKAQGRIMLFRLHTGRTILLALAFCLAGMSRAPAATTDTASPSAMVAAAGPGVYSQTSIGGDRYRLSVTGHKFTSRDDVEKYLAWRSADLTLAKGDRWFRFIETRHQGNAAPVPKRDPAGTRFSFRIAYFQPSWRYRLKGDKDWKSWSPFSGAAFFADGKDASAITEFEASADIQPRKGLMDDADPLAFEADALSDLLVNQVSPPE
jgi:hypothetical protein